MSSIEIFQIANTVVQPDAVRAWLDHIGASNFEVPYDVVDDPAVATFFPPDDLAAATAALLAGTFLQAGQRREPRESHRGQTEERQLRTGPLARSERPSAGRVAESATSLREHAQA